MGTELFALYVFILILSFAFGMFLAMGNIKTSRAQYVLNVFLLCTAIVLLTQPTLEVTTLVTTAWVGLGLGGTV